MSVIEQQTGPVQHRGPSASVPAVRVCLVLLLVFLPSMAQAKTLLHYLIYAFPLNYHENGDKTKRLQLAVVDE